MRFHIYALVILVLHVPKVHLVHEKVERNCNSVLNDKVLLKRATLQSKYVFTGKVYRVNYKNNVRVYKVNIRRVLKGDLNEIGVKVRFGKPKSLRFSDATVMVDSAQSFKCRPLRVRTYAIFLTEKHRDEGLMSLSLVVEPVLLTLRNIAYIEAAVKVIEKVHENIIVLPETRFLLSLWETLSTCISLSFLLMAGVQNV
ncbi:unnamed protein product [Chilo suppressalis]|uniref:NtA domain-containing protein n=1 Tax=Chilo suppressalis TaxID=168631 RepID=A0ABN8BFC2_CHISP|nr:unnamed protein product [Chilo suppressalis]